MISRRQARRQALMLLYQWDLSGAELGSQYAGEIDPWARTLAEEVIAQAAELDARITAASKSWTADRLGAVERSALRVAIHELDRGEVPAEVAIDEAVTFAKRYASDEAGKLVNGILGKIHREEAIPQMSADDALNRAEELLARLEAAREKLEATEDPDEAIEVLQELAELAKAIEAELQRARTDAEAQPEAQPDAEAQPVAQPEPEPDAAGA